MGDVKCPEYGIHQQFLGATGTGKSVLALKMIDFYNYVIIDTQWSINKPDATYYSDPRAVIKNLRKKSKIIYRPKAIFKTKAIWNWFFAQLNDSSINQRGKIHKRVIYIDEIYHIGYGISFPQSIPQGLTTCRQRKISYWIASQRPKNIPIPIMTEATNIYIFFLSSEDDNKYIASFGKNKKDMLQVLEVLTKEQHNFICSSPCDGTFKLFPPIKL